MNDAVAAMPVQRHRVGYIPGLDGIRALSVLSVIALHFGLVLSQRPGVPSWLHHVGPFALGVQMFFVLSGALITSLLVAEHQRTGRISLRGFYLRRWRRLGPTVVALLPLLVLVQLVWTGTGASSPLGSHPLLAVLTVALFVGNWASFRAGSNLAWLQPAWSLGVEEQFYLSWPSVLVLCLRRRLRRRNIYAGLAFAVLLSVVIASLVQRRYGIRATYFATPTQLPCILFGCALGYEITANPRGALTRLLRRRVSALVGVLGVLVVGLEIVDHPAYEYRGGYLPFALFGCLVVGHCFASVDRQSVVTRVLSWRPLEALGKISYEIYLLHAVVILAVFYGRPHLRAYSSMAIDLTLTVAAAALLYSFFDEPIRRFGWRAYADRARAAVVAAGKRVAPTPAPSPVSRVARSSAAGQSRIRYVPALDGMRGISLPGTIYTHFQIFLGFLPTAPWWIRRSGPFTLNIEMFFVLSGALITSLLVAEHQRSSKIALDSFYLRRSRRLGPALLAVVPLLLISQYWLPGSGSTPLGHSPLVTALFILLFVGNWQLATGGNLGWLGPAWTLGIEEQFYLTWPALLRACLRRRWERRHLILAFWTLVVLSSAVGLVLARHEGPAKAVYMTPSQIAPILLGCALGYALTTNADGWFVRLLRYRATAVAGLAGMVAISAFFYTHLTLLVGGGYVLYGASACLLIGHCMAVADRPSIVSRMLGWKPFVVIGQVSYEAYLVHCIVILAVLRVAPRMPVPDMIVLDLALIAAISGAFYYFVEQPIRRHGWLAAFRRRGRARPARVPRTAVYPVRSRAGWLVGVASAAAVVVVAAVMVATAGHTPAGSSVLVGAEPDVASVGLPPASAPTATPVTAEHGGKPAGGVTSPSATTAGAEPDTGPTTTPGSADVPPSSPAAGGAPAAPPPVPSVSGISPLTGPVAGGTDVKVLGTGFVPGAVVYFGSVRATHVRVLNATTLVAVAPAAKLVAAKMPSDHPLHGLRAAVAVRTAGGRSAATAVAFTYV